jgi:hypothetical protein
VEAELRRLDDNFFADSHPKVQQLIVDAAHPPSHHHFATKNRARLCQHEQGSTLA